MKERCESSAPSFLPATVLPADRNGGLAVEEQKKSTDVMSPPVAWVCAGLVCAGLVGGGVAFLDRPLSRFAHDVIGRHDLVRAFQTYPEHLTQLAAALLVVLGLARFFRGRLERLPLTAFTASLSIVSASAIANQLKVIFSRTWPETFVNNNPSFIQDGVYGFFWLHGGWGWGSFPSGHTVAAMSFLAVPAIAYPKWRPFCLFLVLLEALALWAQDYHFFSDIVAGAFLGGAVALVSARIAGLDGPKAN